MPASSSRDRSTCLRRARLSQRLRHELREAIAENRILNGGHMRRDFREQRGAWWRSGRAMGLARRGHVVGLWKFAHPQHDIGNDIRAGYRVKFLNECPFEKRELV